MNNITFRVLCNDCKISYEDFAIPMICGSCGRQNLTFLLDTNQLTREELYDLKWTFEKYVLRREFNCGEPNGQNVCAV